MDGCVCELLLTNNSIFLPCNFSGPTVVMKLKLCMHSMSGGCPSGFLFEQEGWLPPTKRASAAKIN